MDVKTAIRALKELRNSEQRFKEAAQSKRRRMRPSERAMTIAHFAMNVEALDYIINYMEKESTGDKT